MPGGKVLNASGAHDFRLEWPADTIVRLKTGNGGVSGERVSWLIGQLETGGRQYVFASRRRSSGDALDSVAGANLAQRLLNTMTPGRVSGARGVPPSRERFGGRP